MEERNIQLILEMLKEFKAESIESLARRDGRRNKELPKQGRK
jgi:predicted transcriptional regulator